MQNVSRTVLLSLIPVSSQEMGLKAKIKNSELASTMKLTNAAVYMVFVSKLRFFLNGTYMRMNTT